MALLDPPAPAAAVSLVRWPSERAERRRLAAEGVPCLLLVDPGALPPDDCSSDEDWIRSPADPIDLHHRLECLRRAAATPLVQLDEDGLLWRDHRWVALGEVELALVAALLERPGRLVGREVLYAAAWPDGGVDGRALDRGMARVRPKLEALGLQIHCVTGSGYLMVIETDRALDLRNL